MTFFLMLVAFPDDNGFLAAIFLMLPPLPPPPFLLEHVLLGVVVFSSMVAWREIAFPVAFAPFS